LDTIFESLRPLVWPKFREEGPPEFVHSVLLGHDLLGTGSELNASTKSVLELITLGYRPMTSLAILTVLNDSPNTTFHGMQIGRELEKRFKVQEGWFTKTRYYTDRIGKLLPLLARLNLVQESVKKDPKGGRGFTGYQVHPSIASSVTERLKLLSKGEPISLFKGAQASPSLAPSDVSELKQCLSCETIIASVSARFCERCGDPLTIRCQKCNNPNEATYDYCLKCGNKMS